MAHVVDENRVAALAEYELPQPEFMQVKTRDGFVDGSDDDQAAELRSVEEVPGLPVSSTAGRTRRASRNRWGGRACVDAVHCSSSRSRASSSGSCDNRTASGKGAVSAWPVYKNFGESELRDIEDGIAWLKAAALHRRQPRSMLSGWSYGGFMTAYALTHSKTFAAGIAGGPVTDWRDYDSIYTERYMLMPQNNPEGYRRARRASRRRTCTASCC